MRTWNRLNSVSEIETGTGTMHFCQAVLNTERPFPNKSHQNENRTVHIVPRLNQNETPTGGTPGERRLVRAVLGERQGIPQKGVGAIEAENRRSEMAKALQK